MRFLPSRRARLVTLVTFIALMLAGTVAYATIPDSHGIIHTCFSKATGTWRPIDYPTEQCKKVETQMDLYSVAGANAAFSSVTVNNTSANPVPVREQNLDTNGSIKVHEQGTANVNVTGTVTTQAAVPSHPFYLPADGDDGCGENLPAGTKWFLTVVGGSNLLPNLFVEGTGTLGYATVAPELAGPGGGSIPGPQLFIPGGDSRQFTFPQPYVLTSPAAGYCLKTNADGAIPLVVGYRQ